MSNKCEFCVYRDMCSRYGEGMRRCPDFDIDREEYSKEVRRRERERKRQERLNDELAATQMGKDDQKFDEAKL